MKFSTLAALMATTTAIKIDQTTATKVTGTTAVKTTDSSSTEPHYEIEGLLKLVGNSTASHHEGPDLNDEMAEADKSHSVSAATPNNPLQDVQMTDVKYKVGGQLDIILNPSPMGGFFYIDMLIDHGHWLYVEMYGVEDYPESSDGGCMIITHASDTVWEGIEYCLKKEHGRIDDLFEAGPEIQVQFLENGIDIRVLGHLINEEMSDFFEIYGGSAGKHTFTSSHPMGWESYNMVDVYHGYGKHITEVAMS